MTIDEMNISARAKNCLKGAGFYDVQEIKDMKDEEFLVIHHFNEKCLSEVRKEIDKYKKGINYQMFFQFDQKSYSVEDLKNILNDVWVYDLGRNKEEIHDVEMYIRTEDSKAYYVVNGNETGCFSI